MGLARRPAACSNLTSSAEVTYERQRAHAKGTGIMTKRPLLLGGVFTLLGWTATAQAEEQDPALVQMGIFGGLLFPSGDHALHAQLPQQSFKTVAAEIGARLAVVP